MTLNRKINRLYNLLIKEKGAFELAAGRVSEKSMRFTVLTLAQQSNQYATELLCYIQSAGSPAIMKNNDTGIEKDKLPDEKGVLAFCKCNEQKLVNAYRRILKESLGYESLGRMLGYQLEGIIAASMQLKLLTSLEVAAGR